MNVVDVGVNVLDVIVVVVSLVVGGMVTVVLVLVADVSVLLLLLAGVVWFGRQKTSLSKRTHLAPAGCTGPVPLNSSHTADTSRYRIARQAALSTSTHNVAHISAEPTSCSLAPIRIVSLK